MYLIAFSGGQDSLNLLIRVRSGLVIACPPPEGDERSRGLQHPTGAKCRVQGKTKPSGTALSLSFKGKGRGFRPKGGIAKPSRPTAEPEVLGPFTFEEGKRDLRYFYGESRAKNPEEANAIVWCNHLWKIQQFYLLRHCFQINRFFGQRFFFTIFCSKSFSEKKARNHRYYLFSRIGIYSQSEILFTAHTQNDNIETFFFNLFRGSGKFGLQILRDWRILLNNEYSQKFA